MKELYGVENAFQSKELMKDAAEKSKQTLLKRYNVTHNWLIPEVQDKTQKTKKNNYFTKPEIVENRESIIKWAENFRKIHGKKPIYEDLAKEENCSYNEICSLVNRYRIKSWFKVGVFSVFENSVEDFIKTLNVKYIKHNRTQINPQELDFYFPEARIAIEVNDIASHNSTSGFKQSEAKDKHYHYHKSKKCEENNIRLIHVWEYEWFNERQRPILENIIKNALGINNQKIYARKCKTIIKKSREMREFFDKNNIQGFRGRSICYLFRI